MIRTISKRTENEFPLKPRHIGVPLGASKMTSEPMVCLTQTMHLSCTDTSTVSKRIETRFDMTHYLRVPSGASKTISEPMVRLVQTMHLCCTDTNTVSKWTETRFHMTPSPRSSIVCIQNNFPAYGTFGANRAPILSHY